MKTNESFLELFQKTAKEQRFVFNETDLKVLLNEDNDQSFYRAIKKLLEMGLVKRFSRGIYVSKGFNLFEVNRKMAPESYVSFEYALAKNSLIGTYGPNLLRSVMPTGRTRRFSFQNNVIEQIRITPEIYFGFTLEDGYNVASREKAFLDCLYFYTKGMRFAFDLFSDVDLSLLDKKVLSSYLKKYRNPRFVAFVKGVLK